MMKQFRIAIPILLCLAAEPALAKKNTKNPAAKAVAAAPVKSNPAADKTFQVIMEKFRKGELQKKAMWEALAPFDASFNELSQDNKAAYKQVRSQLLFLSGYPILASEFAAEALTLSTEPFSEKHTPLWRILWIVYKEKSSQYIVEDIALRINSKLPLPPEFGNNWNYIVGNALMATGKADQAKAAYSKLVMQDRFFLPAQYQLSMLSIEANKGEEAESYLNGILNPTTLSLSELRGRDQTELINFTHMALGRLYYQQQKFVESAKQYRMVMRASSQFYEALFEQSWSLFMSGSMKHALGTLYAVNAPYFKEHFNPEAKLLESMIYYWMCRYDDARNSLADFATNNRESIDSLGVWLDRQHLTPETSYQLFENLISGVSEGAIGIPIKVLQTAAESDVMQLAREQYATLIEEMNALETYGIFGQTQGTGPYKDILMRRVASVRNEIGKLFLEELQNLKAHFEELYSQSQFLYLELLMSQKEQILGRELHAESKISKVTDKDAFNGWSRKTQSWQDNKNEYWWDEIGYQIIDVDPECKL